MDGADHEGEDLDPLTLPAGTQVSFEATVEPDCGDLQESPVIEFRIPASLPDGEQVVDTWSPSNPEAYWPAIRLLCNVGIAVQAGGGSLGDGDNPSRVALLIGNAGPDDITVEVPALESGGASWEELVTTVPAGQQVTTVVQGWGVPVRRQPGGSVGRRSPPDQRRPAAGPDRRRVVLTRPLAPKVGARRYASQALFDRRVSRSASASSGQGG